MSTKIFSSFELYENKMSVSPSPKAEMLLQAPFTEVKSGRSNSLINHSQNELSVDNSSSKIKSTSLSRIDSTGIMVCSIFRFSQICYNVLRIWLVAVFEALSCRIAPNLLKSTKLEFTTFSAIRSEERRVGQECSR